MAVSWVCHGRLLRFASVIGLADSTLLSYPHKRIPSMPTHLFKPLAFTRRRALHALGSALGVLHLPTLAQTTAAAPAGAPIVVAQVVDLSRNLQDVGRDFLSGAQSAWQSTNASGGIQGRPVRHLTIPVDGSAQSMREAWLRIQRAADCVVLSGCVGDAATRAMTELQTRSGTGASLAQVAPWVQAEDSYAPGSNVFGIFPGYQEQMAHALQSLATVGVRELGVAFADADQRARALPAVSRAAKALGLALQPLGVPGQPASDAERLAQRHQIMVLFVGGTPELHDFALRLPAQSGGRRYVIALADVNLQVLAQMGGVPRHTSVIATQAVPLLTSSLAVVRAYRKALAHFYDEPPSPQGLAGFLAARYTAAVLSGVRGTLSRTSVLQALRDRSDTDVDGFVVRCEGAQRRSTYVTQTMLAADGRLIG